MDEDKEKAILKEQIEECKRVIYRHDGVMQYCAAQLQRLEKEGATESVKPTEIVEMPPVGSAHTNGAA
jgi:hypothetical protein